MIPNEGKHLPFDVLGKIGPILCWVESDSGPQLPSSWSSSAIDYKAREREWLLQELPTFSYDNVEDIVHFARADMKWKKRSSFGESSTPRLRAPQDYDLKDAFQSLAQHYFVWNGGEMCVREGRMEELHELGLRFPVGHLIRHGHARAVARGLVSVENALDLPEQMSLLPSNSFGLRTVVRRGLSENHLHLTGVTSAEEHWADSLLKGGIVNSCGSVFLGEFQESGCDPLLRLVVRSLDASSINKFHTLAYEGK